MPGTPSNILSIGHETCFNKICTISQKPTICIAHPAANAIEYITPMQAPNSGPSERDIIKYVPPSFNTPFVLIADIDNAVMVVIAPPNNIIIIPETGFKIY